MTYKNIPVDDETYQKLQALCVAYELGKRAQGAMVRKLVNAEFQKWNAVKLLLQVAPVVSEIVPAPESKAA